MTLNRPIKGGLTSLVRNSESIKGGLTSLVRNSETKYLCVVFSFKEKFIVVEFFFSH